MFMWTNEEIEKILIQLDEKCFPFPKYAFSRQEGRLKLLGRGASGLVYEAGLRKKHKPKYAMKVIGFGGKSVDSEVFKASVEAQKDLGILENSVVEVYDYAEIFVQIDEENRVIAVEKDEKTNEVNVLKLQFIVMEKITAVVSHTKSGKFTLMPDKLRICDETEILRVAYDIGDALARAHEKNILHRDVKLENIFYSSKGKHYKLGDFGIAKKTKNGMADTIAYTNGYGAPEVVGNLDDKYDKTADIYSLGILLYVLLNKMRFPDSESYHVNSKIQYSSGYQPSRPEHGSDELCRIIEKMCMFYPDDRYQSMDEVLHELERLIFNSEVGYKKEHKNATLVLGTICMFLGTVVWKVSFFPLLQVKMSGLMYVFLALAAWKCVCKYTKRDVSVISVMLLGVGISVLISTDFSWLKLLLLLGIVASSGTFCMFFVGVVLILNMLSIPNIFPDIEIFPFESYRWVAVLLLSISLFLLLQYYVLQERARIITRIYLSKNVYWVCIAILYLCCINHGYWLGTGKNDVLVYLLGKEFANELITWDLMKVGISGVVFSMVWIIREKILIRLDERKRNV